MVRTLDCHRQERSHGITDDRPSGYRDYPPETVTRIVFIRRAKDLGFSLKEIKALLELRVRPRRNCALVKRNADAKIGDNDSKIAALRKMRRALTSLTKACRERTPTTECPILTSLG